MVRSSNNCQRGRDLQLQYDSKSEQRADKVGGAQDFGGFLVLCNLLKSLAIWVPVAGFCILESVHLMVWVSLQKLY